MVTLKDAIEALEVIYLDEFRAACKDKPTRPDTVLDLHRYFKYQVRVYTFSATQHVPRIYNDLRTGKISDGTITDTNDLSYPLLFLTELSQRLLIDVSSMYAEIDERIDVTQALRILSIQLAEILTAHTHTQDYIEDEHYQSSLDVDTWSAIFVSNPWLLVGTLLRFTSSDLIENLYVVYVENQELIKELKDK